MDNFNKPLIKSAIRMLYSDDNIETVIKDLHDRADCIKNVKRLSRKNIISALSTFAIRLELLK